MRFAHFADCHIGSWKDPRLSSASTLAFIKAIDICISKSIDFLLISGDLFNTALPSIEHLKLTVEKLKQLKDKNIPVYIIAGSHDYSPSGKSMIEVIKNAGLLTIVSKADIQDNKLKLKFTTDPKTKIKITGILGKKGGLEKEYYKNLLKDHLKEEPGYKIFMFHTLLTEFKPDNLKESDSHPLSLLPKGFDYYAGGHPHFVFLKQEKEYGHIAYPGPLFPNNFNELEELKRGGFYIINIDDIKVSDNETETLTSIKWEPVQIYNVHSIILDAENKTPEQVNEDLDQAIRKKQFNNTIITIRITGTLISGKLSDINFKDIFEKLYNRSAYFVMKNTNKLHTKEFEEIKVNKSNVEDIESELIKEHLQKIKVKGLDKDKEMSLTVDLMNILSSEKQEGETISTFEDRIKSETDKILDIEYDKNDKDDKNI